MDRTITVIDAAAALVLLLGWWVALANYSTLPSRIPTHFNFKGQADNYGPPWMILLLPAISTVVCAVIYYTTSASFAGGRIPVGALVPMHVLMLEISILFAYLAWRTVEISFDRASGIGNFAVLVIVLAAVLTVAWLNLAKKR